MGLQTFEMKASPVSELALAGFSSSIRLAHLAELVHVEQIQVARMLVPLHELRVPECWLVYQRRVLLLEEAHSHVLVEGLVHQALHHEGLLLKLRMQVRLDGLAHGRVGRLDQLAHGAEVHLHHRVLHHRIIAI